MIHVQKITVVQFVFHVFFSRITPGLHTPHAKYLAQGAGGRRPYVCMHEQSLLTTWGSPLGMGNYTVILVGRGYPLQ